MTVGERVKKLAEKQGISLRELAKKAELSYNTVYSITRRGSERVAPDTISRLANALGVNVNELTVDASIRVNSAPEMVELQQKVAAGQATEQEKQAWLEANLKGLESVVTWNFPAISLRYSEPASRSPFSYLVIVA